MLVLFTGTVFTQAKHLTPTFFRRLPLEMFQGTLSFRTRLRQLAQLARGMQEAGIGILV